MDDLIKFLRARLDEVEWVAREASETRFTHPLLAPWAEAETRFRASSGTAADLAVATIADPARVLARVDANRRIVELHTASTDGAGEGECWTCQEKYPCDTLRLLALPDAGHPDYRLEWRP